MNFQEAMDLLKAGKKVTRKSWDNNLYFVIEDGKIQSYQTSLEYYAYTEEIMMSDGWVTSNSSEPREFCEIISDLQLGNKAWMSHWSPEIYIYLDSSRDLLIHKMLNSSFIPVFSDFKTNDWIEI